MKDKKTPIYFLAVMVWFGFTVALVLHLVRR